METSERISKRIDEELLHRGLLSRFEIAMRDAKALAESHQERLATALLESGLCLIPSDHLLDNQFVVSRGVYEAAQRVCKDRKDL